MTSREWLRFPDWSAAKRVDQSTNWFAAQCHIPRNPADALVAKLSCRRPGRPILPTLDIFGISSRIAFLTERPRLIRKSGNSLNPLQTVNLTALMEGTEGRAEIVIGLIDGPVAFDHVDLTTENIRALPEGGKSRCAQADSLACQHGTFIAGILVAKRGSVAPALCPGCTLLVRPLFEETTMDSGHMPSATPEELAAALIESMDAGARVINLSIALASTSSRGQHAWSRRSTWPRGGEFLSSPLRAIRDWSAVPPSRAIPGSFPLWPAMRSEGRLTNRI